MGDGSRGNPMFTPDNFLSNIMSLLPVGVILVDHNCRIIFASALVSKDLGLPDGETPVGSTLSKWIHPHDREKLAEYLCRMKDPDCKHIQHDFRLLQHDQWDLSAADLLHAKTHWAELTFIPWKCDSLVEAGTLITMRDVTVNKQIELRLEQNLEQQAFLSNLLQMMYRPNDLCAALGQVIDLIGIFFHASHVCLVENSPDGQVAEITMQWSANGVKPHNAHLVCMSYREYPSVQKQFESPGLIAITDYQTLPADLARLLAQLDVRSFAAVPIYGKEDLFGFIAFDYVDLPRAWSPEDLDLLRNISRTVSNAVTRYQMEEEERNQWLMAELLRDTATVLNSKLSFHEVLDYTLSNLGRMIPNQAACILLLNSHGTLELAHSRGYDQAVIDYFHKNAQTLQKSVAVDELVQAGEPVLIANVLSDSRLNNLLDFVSIRSIIWAPIRAHGKLLGFLSVTSPISGFFTQEHAARLQAFANQAAVSIENARLYQDAQLRADEMTTLYKIGLTLASGLDLDQVLETLYDQCSEILPHDAFLVALYDDETYMMEVPLYKEEGFTQAIAPRNLRTHPGLVGEVIFGRKTLYLSDVLDKEAVKNHSMYHVGGSTPVRSFVGVPLIARDHVIGVISMQSYQPDFYNDEQIRLLETIANQAAIAIENARIFKRMKQLAITDSLTGLYTRRHFTSLGQMELERALRYGHPLAVLMVDIDFFKQVNDTRGHSVGDQVLQAVAAICRSQLRQSDIIGRYGGEEFAIILPETSPEGAYATAERIRNLVEISPISTLRGEIFITASLGLAVMDERLTSLESLLDCADRAMYTAKRSGRNQVRVYGDNVSLSTVYT